LRMKVRGQVVIKIHEYLDFPDQVDQGHVSSFFKDTVF
jgi:hypothetical protein